MPATDGTLSDAAVDAPTKAPMNTILLTVEGMTCGGCVKGVTGVLSGVAGVVDAKVVLESKTATVQTQGDVSADTLINAVNETGKKASLKEPMKSRSVDLTVEGMTCGGCVNGVTGALTGVPGVISAKVDLESKTATVQVEDHVLVDSLIKAVNEKGKKAVLKAS